MIATTTRAYPVRIASDSFLTPGLTRISGNAIVDTAAPSVPEIVYATEIQFSKQAYLELTLSCESLMSTVLLQ